MFKSCFYVIGINVGVFTLNSAYKEPFFKKGPELGFKYPYIQMSRKYHLMLTYISLIQLRVFVSDHCAFLYPVISYGISFLSIFRDLKLENILLDEKYKNVKVIGK